MNRTAIIGRGKQNEATAFAANVSDYLTQNLGVTVTWGLEMGGTVGRVHWFATYDSLAHMEEVLGRTMTDEGYQELLAEAASLFPEAPEDTLVYIM